MAPQRAADPDRPPEGMERGMILKRTIQQYLGRVRSRPTVISFYAGYSLR